MCPACGDTSRSPVATLKGVPVFCNALLDSREAALNAPTGDLELVMCTTCGLLYNAAFEPDLVRYSPRYENSLHFSGTFRRYARALAERLIERYGLHGKTIVEIGSGSGEFLSQLCEMGDNRGFGFDPSHDSRRDRRVDDDSGRVQIVPRLFDRNEEVGADFLLCQHVLEHIADPADLLTTIRAGLHDPRGGPDATAYFEVPDAGYMLQRLALWDLIYEHCSYFTAPTLVALFEATGFTVLDHGTSFSDQYLWIEAAPSGSASGKVRVDPNPLTPLEEAASTFGQRLRREADDWSERVEKLAADGDVVVWGAGSKGVTFLNLIDTAPRITGAVDINPRKTGLRIPGTGHRVVLPAELPTDRAVHVVLMNAVYEGEVRATLEELGVDGTVHIP